MFKNESNRLDELHQKTRRSRGKDIKWNDFDMRKSLQGCHLHQLVFAQADLATRVAGPTPEWATNVLQEDQRVTVVCLEKQKLPARLQEPVNSFEVAIGMS